MESHPMKSHASQVEDADESNAVSERSPAEAQSAQSSGKIFEQTSPLRVLGVPAVRSLLDQLQFTKPFDAADGFD